MSDNLLMLLEMIEESLDEALPSSINRIVSLVSTIAPESKIKKQNKNRTELTNTGSRADRAEIISFLSNKLSNSINDYDLDFYTGVLPDGSADMRIVIKQDDAVKHQIFLKQGSVGSRINATKFEMNLVNALNKNVEDFKPNVGAGTDFQNLADSIIDNLKNKEVLDGRTFSKLDQDGTTLTKTYSDLGVTSREPKTDIISNDGVVRISVKKKGGQFISSQGNETAAVVKSVLQKNPKLADKLTSLIKNYFSYKKGYSVLKNKTPEEKKKIKMIRNFFLKRFTNFMGGNFTEMLAIEALTGNNKFEDPESKPNYVLVWDESGNGNLYTMEDFIRLSLPKVKFGVRGRGGTRGLSLRGEF
jgi:hypothetical protein